MNHISGVQTRENILAMDQRFGGSNYDPKRERRYNMNKEINGREEFNNNRKQNQTENMVGVGGYVSQ
jgi:hypothetical protein